jgi:transposase InsO family protein
VLRESAQFTSSALIGLLRDHGIAISTHGKGRWRDNVFIEGPVFARYPRLDLKIRRRPWP